MNVKGLAISGRQVPNSVGVECIKTTKLYDWVILTNRDRNKVPIPKKCLALIKKCHGCDGQLNIVCQEIKKTRTCKILEEKQIEIGVASAKIVTLLFSSEISISVTCTRADCECQKDCHFKVPITFIDDVILCHPEGTEIKCSIYEVYCQVLSNEILGDIVLLDVTMCKEMVVEGEAILELEGKFCGPRDPIELSADYSACAFPTFPSQCPEFFPADTCECQGDAEVINSTETILVNGGNGLSPVRGALTLSTVICNQCSIQGSQFSASFVDFPGQNPTSPTPEDEIEQSFTFLANGFSSISCTNQSLTVNGTGVFSQAGQLATNAIFTLVLNQSLNTIQTDIRLLDTTPLATIQVVSSNVTVADCLDSNR